MSGPMSAPDAASTTVRRATADDLELVISRRLQFFCEMRGWTLAELSDDFLEANRRFIERTHGNSFHTWFAEVEGACVGLVSMVVSDAPPRPEELREADGYIVNMHVDLDHRSRGIGRLLVDRCMADAEAQGVRRFTLNATADGRPLYESMGFVDEGGWMNRYA